jgi:hypothetical protein
MSSPRLCASVLGLLGVTLFASPLWAQATPHTAAAAKPPAAATSATAAPPQLNDSAELARVVSLYEAGRYGDCADSLKVLLSEDGARPLRDRDVIENARIYRAACLIGSGSPQLADEPLRAAIRQNPQMKPPDSLVFPPQVIDRFLRVRETMFDVIKKAEDERVRRAQELAKLQEERARHERARVAGLERLGQQETLVTPRTRWLALVPFGVGQFQNGKETLGYVFLTSEVLLAASTVTTLGIETHLVLQANRIQRNGGKPAAGTNDTLTNWHTALTASSYAWLGVSLIGIVEAQLSFVPEQRRAQKRPLPLELRPAVEPMQGGAVFGLSGRF